MNIDQYKKNEGIVDDGEAVFRAVDKIVPIICADYKVQLQNINPSFFLQELGIKASMDRQNILDILKCPNTIEILALTAQSEVSPLTKKNIKIVEIMRLVIKNMIIFCQNNKEQRLNRQDNFVFSYEEEDDKIDTDSYLN